MAGVNEEEENEGFTWLPFTPHTHTYMHVHESKEKRKEKKRKREERKRRRLPEEEGTTAPEVVRGVGGRSSEGRMHGREGEWVRGLNMRRRREEKRGGEELPEE